MSSILSEAEEIINGARAISYGSPLKSFKRVAKLWSGILDTEVSEEQVCLCMVALKMARETNKHSRDNLVDIAGYAGVLEKVLEEKDCGF